MDRSIVILVDETWETVSDTAVIMGVTDDEYDEIIERELDLDTLGQNDQRTRVSLTELIQCWNRHNAERKLPDMTARRPHDVA